MNDLMLPALGSPEEARALLAAIVDSSDDAIISKDLHGIVRSWNAGATRTFGYAPEEMVGQPITRLFPPDRLDEEPQILARLQRGEKVDHIRTVRLHKDGHPVAVSVTISPIRDAAGNIVGASKVARDVSATAALEGMYAAIITSSDDAIVSKDLNGVVRSWNPAATRMFGYAADEMIGQSITRLFPADRLDEEPKILEQLRRGQRVDHFETVRVRKDGRPIDVSVTISPVRDAAGTVIGVSKVARDVTAIKRALAEREQLLRREQAARAEAERASRMKDEFLSTLSHELRTPLNAILGWANMLRGGHVNGGGGAEGGINSPEDLREGLETIERNARSQAQLIDELLDMSRIVNGKLRLDLQAVELAGVVGAAVDSLRPAADAKRIRLTSLLDPRAGPIHADPNRLQQVLWNLLSNAVKFTPAGGRVQVLLQRVNSHLEITVADTGQGIPREFLPRLFDRFSQAETSTTRRHGGLGLGLAIVRSIVELHGGTVTATSPGEGQGATFVVALPVAIAPVERGPGAAHPAAEPPTGAVPANLPRLDGYRVLIVDDEPDARALVERILRRCGAEVTGAGEADEAFDLVRRGRFDLILSDIGMPGQDGYQFLQRVRALPRDAGGDTPAVAITAFARSEDRRRALLAGFQMHLPKPVEPAELIAVVASHHTAFRRASADRP